MFCVLVDKDGLKDVLEAKVVWNGVLIGMVDIVVSSELEDPRRWGISPVGPVGGVVSPGAEEVEAVSLVDGMGMFCVLVDKDGVKDMSVSKDGMVKDVLGARVVWKGVLIGEGMVNIVVASGPVGTGPGPVGGGPEGLVPGPAVGLSVGLGGAGVVATMSMGPLGPPVGGRGLLEVLLLHLQNFFLGKHFSA